MRHLYTLLLYFLQPIIWLRLLWRSLTAAAYRKRWLERYGFISGTLIRPHGILIHAVSVGETMAAVPLIRILQQHYPNLPITVTTMTPTGSERVQALFGNSIQHMYLPYDLPGAMRRFLMRLQPKLVIIMETELWPNMIDQLSRQHTPILLANARLSERSARGYHKLGSLSRTLLQQITLIAAQHQDDADRFLALSYPAQQMVITGSLKFDIKLDDAVQKHADILHQQWGADRPIWIAASTHQGEDEIILAAHQALLADHPNLLLILVPRHPERFALVTRLTQQAKLRYVTRSSGQPPSDTTQVMIGDTMGELMLFYAMSDFAFVGGSLVDHGGQNPLEAAACAIPILMGPSCYNFQDICQKLAEKGALQHVDNAMMLHHYAHTLLSDSAKCAQLGEAALTTLQQNQGALSKTVALITHLLADTVVK